MSFDTSVRRLSAALHATEEQRRSSASAALADAAERSAQRISDTHAGLATGIHGVGSAYLAKTSRSDQWPDWADIQGKPTLPLSPANGGTGASNTGNLTWASGGGTAALLESATTIFDGKLGVGGAIPTYAFEVIGRVRVNSGNDNGVFMFKDTTAAQTAILGMNYYDDTNVAFGSIQAVNDKATPANRMVRLYIGGIERQRWLNSGAVWIGKTSGGLTGAGDLDVAGRICGTKVGIENTNPDKQLAFAGNFFGFARDANYNFGLACNLYHDGVYGTRWRTSNRGGYGGAGSILMLVGGTLAFLSAPAATVLDGQERDLSSVFYATAYRSVWVGKDSGLTGVGDLDAAGRIRGASLETAAGSLWQLAGYTASGDTSSNGYVTITIDGVNYKLMTRA